MDIKIIDKYDKLKVYDKNEMAKGIKVEHEHIVKNNKYSKEEKNQIAKYIAKAHLSELKDYYARLEFMENMKTFYLYHNEMIFYVIRINKNLYVIIKKIKNKKDMIKGIKILDMGNRDDVHWYDDDTIFVESK